MQSGNFSLSNNFGFSKQPKKITIKNLKVSAGVPANFEESSWSTLKDAIRAIYEERPVAQSFEELYKLVENLCLFALADKIYARVTAEIDTKICSLQHTLEIYCQTLYPFAFLESFEGLWCALHNHTKLIQNIFLYLDRTYAVQHPSLLSIRDFTFAKFKEHLIDGSSAIKYKLITSLVDCVERERQAVTVERAALKKITKILVDLDIYNAFEESFLESSRVYYEQTIRKNIADLPISSYLIFVNSKILEESTRIDECFSVKSKRPILDIVDDLGLKRQKEILLGDGLRKLFDEHELAGLEMFFMLFERIGELAALKTAFNWLLREKGAQIVRLIDTSEASDVDIVKKLLVFRSKMFDVLSFSFKNNENFSNAIKDSFEYFINTKQNKPAELVAKYFDFILKEAASSTSADATTFSLHEQTINELMSLFRYIHGKDIFEGYYKKDLSKRLLLNRTVCHDLENLVLSKLKLECGPGFTSKIEGMFKDVANSRQLMRTFNDHQSRSPIAQPSFDFHCQVLTNAFWPPHPDSDVLLPKEVADLRDSFKQFYETTHNSRHLAWQNALSTCTLKANFPKGPKELLVSAHQAAILVLFNDQDTLSYEFIRNATQISVVELKKTLLSLCCSKVRILVKEPKTPDIDEADCFAYNKDFCAKLFRLKINTIQLKESVEDLGGTAIAASSSAPESINGDRQLQIDSAIMKSMKASKSMSHSALLAEIVPRLSFVCKTLDVKKRIESLIERDYLARDKSNPNMYFYVS